MVEMSFENGDCSSEHHNRFVNCILFHDEDQNAGTDGSFLHTADCSEPGTGALHDWKKLADEKQLRVVGIVY